MDFIDTYAVAELAGIDPRRVRRAFLRITSGQTSLWRGAELEVRVRHGQGGRSGIQYEVRVSSLPYQLQQRFNDHLKGLETSIKATGDKAQAERNWRLNTIYPALIHARGSNERAAAVRAIAADRHIDLHGKVKKLSARVLYEWIKDYERTGTVAALSRTKRIDAGVRRYLISKAWDKAVPFDDELKAEIASNTINIIRGYIAKGMARSKVSILTGEYLANATRDNGFRINDPDRIAHICRIPDRLIQEQRSYKNIYDLNYDAKRAHDKKPRIRRTIGDMEPMDCVVLDVHKINVLVEREDGKAVTPYLLGFLDVATRRCWCELVLTEKRGAVRNYDQITAFMAMAVHPAFGLPKTIYVDNGKEYLFADFLECALKLGVDVDQITGKERKSQIVHSIPYNAAAKEIEAWFGHFEQHFLRSMRGWIDDDRFDPKRPALGKLPKPYEGGFTSFSKSLFLLNKSYETFPQKGKLKGKSPSEALQMHIDNGWAATIIDPKDFLTAFTRPEKRMLRQGSFRYDSRAWTCDELIQHPDPQITVHVPAFGLGFNELRVDDLNGDFLAIARPDIEYEYLDPRGAVESARRSKLWNKTLRSMEAGIPDLNIELELIERGQQALPVHPNTPDGIVSISDYLPAAEVIIPTTLSPSSKTQEEREEEEFQKNQLEHLKMYKAGLQKMKENGLL